MNTLKRQEYTAEIYIENQRIRHWKMFHADNEKWEKRNNRRNRTAKSGKDQNAGRKRNLQVLENMESGHHQTSREERKNKKKGPLKNKKCSQNQALQQESH